MLCTVSENSFFVLLNLHKIVGVVGVKVKFNHHLSSLSLSVQLIELCNTRPECYNAFLIKNLSKK